MVCWAGVNGVVHGARSLENLSLGFYLEAARGGCITSQKMGCSRMLRVTSLKMLMVMQPLVQ